MVQWTGDWGCYKDVCCSLSEVNMKFRRRNLRKKRLRLHSFGPFWTISTENQWEISEVGRLRCFIEFVCLISHCL